MLSPSLRSKRNRISILSKPRLNQFNSQFHPAARPPMINILKGFTSFCGGSSAWIVPVHALLFLQEHDELMSHPRAWVLSEMTHVQWSAARCIPLQAKGLALPIQTCALLCVSKPRFQLRNYSDGVTGRSSNALKCLRLVEL